MKTYKYQTFSRNRNFVIDLKNENVSGLHPDHYAATAL